MKYFPTIKKNVHSVCKTHFLKIPDCVYSKMEILVFKKNKNESIFTDKIGCVNSFISVITPLAAQKCDSKGIQSAISWTDMAFEFK